MTEEKMVEIFNKIYNSLNDEQKAEAEKCESAEEFLAVADKAGVEVPDEFLDEVAGGAAVNASTLNQVQINQSTLNSSTVNASAINQSTLNQTTLNKAAIYQGTVTTKTAYMPLGGTMIGTPVKTQSFQIAKSGWGTVTGKKL